MNNKIFLTIVLTSLLLACTEDKELIPNNTVPVVSQNANNADFVFYALEDKGHGAWGSTLDGKSLSDLSFTYVVDVQNLIAE